MYGEPWQSLRACGATQCLDTCGAGAVENRRRWQLRGNAVESWQLGDMSGSVAGHRRLCDDAVGELAAVAVAGRRGGGCASCAASCGGLESSAVFVLVVLFSMTWSWEVYDGGFEDGSNLRSGWRS
jgi:hypothetical protein